MIIYYLCYIYYASEMKYNVQKKPTYIWCVVNAYNAYDTEKKYSKPCKNLVLALMFPCELFHIVKLWWVLKKNLEKSRNVPFD